MDIKVRDSNGALLAEGDSVTLIKDLKLKGSSTVLKRGTMLLAANYFSGPPSGSLAKQAAAKDAHKLRSSRDSSCLSTSKPPLTASCAFSPSRA